MNRSLRRLSRDFKMMKENIKNGELKGVTVRLKDDTNFYFWLVRIEGVKNTDYEGQQYELGIEFSSNYPMEAPLVNFVNSDMFHPNVYRNGRVCLDILDNKWSPCYDVEMVVVSIQSLLDDPNVSSPANLDAAKLYESNRDKYRERIMRLYQPLELSST